MKTLKASEKVEFSRPLSGAEIIQATKQVIGNRRGNPDEPMFYMEQRDKLGFAFSVGQTSGFQYQHLLVVPRSSAGWLHPDYLSVRDTYASVEVMSQFLPRRQMYCVPFGEDEIKEAVRDFAAKLRQHPMVR